jgi:hypothetical protein
MKLIRQRPNFLEILSEVTPAVHRAFVYEGVDSLDKLLALKAEDIRVFRYCGPSGLKSVRQALWRRGLLLKNDKIVAIIAAPNEEETSQYPLSIVGDVEMPEGSEWLPNPTEARDAKEKSL